MTLRAREQDIRRDKAASNICTNQALCALAATVYLAALGPHGLRDVAASGASRARRLEDALTSAGAPRVHAAPYLNEFAIRVPRRHARPRRIARAGASWRACRWRRLVSRRRPPARRRCWCARRRSRRTTRSSGSRRPCGRSCRRTWSQRPRRASASRPGRGRAARSWAPIGRRAVAPAHPGRAVASRARQPSVPHPPADALDRIPAEQRRADAGGPARAERARRSSATSSTCRSSTTAVDTGFYPLGSCTMKYNPKINEWAARLPGFAALHPAGARRRRAGHARAAVGAGAVAGGDQRHEGRDAPARRPAPRAS